MTDFYRRVVTDPYANYLGIRFDRIEPGVACCSLVVTENMFNFLGVVHGGLVFSLADAAFSAASNRDHCPSFALDVSGSFLKTARLGDLIRAEAHLVQATNRTGLYRMNVYNGDNLMATFNGTVYKTKDRSGKKTDPVQDQVPSVWTESLTGLTFVPLPGGSFMMGDQTGTGHENEKPVHQVILRPFYMATTAVTRKQWLAVTGETAGSESLAPETPVTHVDFNEVDAFISRLNRRYDDRTFQLPTEAQWEYAARGGGRHSLYAGSDDPDEVAWFGENSDGRPRAVATKKPNVFGLYDMSGNVWEWCLDRFDDQAYKHHDKQNPLITGHSDKDRVARGGSWLMDAWSIRCARRFSFPEDVSGNGLGFRLVMLMKSQGNPHGGKAS